MSTRGVGILLILTSIIALGALAQSYRLDRSMAGERAATEAMERETGAMGEAIGRLQAAHVARVADAQSATNWRGRVAALTDEIDAGLAKRRAATRDAGAAAAYDEAAGALRRLRTLDARVNASLDQGDRLHAADLVFIDEAVLIKSAAESLAAARDRDRQAIDRNLTQLARLRLAMTGVAMVFVLGVAIYFGRAVTTLGGHGTQSTVQMLRDLPPPVKPAASPAVSPPAAAVQPAPPNLNRPSSLSAAAELCVDLAQVVDARDVPALLERTASVLEARGIVLWAVDPDGARLRPSLSYGYSERVLRKLRPLQVDADNVTSLAYRSLQPQAINGASAGDSAAIAIPLLTATGCVGVMAAELRHNRPHVDLLPVARILGAQFSTLIATPDASDRMSAQA
jgi:hypothetical protein